MCRWFNTCVYELLSNEGVDGLILVFVDCGYDLLFYGDVLRQCSYLMYFIPALFILCTYHCSLM